jgi:hypothetical protein
MGGEKFVSEIKTVIKKTIEYDLLCNESWSNYTAKQGGEKITESDDLKELLDDLVDDVGISYPKATKIHFDIDYSAICDGQDSKIIATFEEVG